MRMPLVFCFPTLTENENSTCSIMSYLPPRAAIIILVIIIIAGFFFFFCQSKTVDAVFQGLRPASTALIAAAGLSVALSVLVTVGGTAEHTFAFRWPAVILCAAVFVCMRYTPLKKLHPVAFIAAAAVIGAVFQF